MMQRMCCTAVVNNFGQGQFRGKESNLFSVMKPIVM
jgi:hypothetical protein